MRNPFDIQGRVAVVIGGTSGIGKTLALGLAGAGVHTIATGRRGELVEQVTREIESLGVRSLAKASDVEDEASMIELRESILEAFGHVHILVNAAGRTIRKPTIHLSTDEWNGLMETNLTGALRACQVFFEPLRLSGCGRIINVASLASFLSFHNVSAYSASKAGLMSLTQSLGCEWAKFGIRTNAIVPGVFVTDINRVALLGTGRGKEMLERTPLGRFGDIEELVGAALFLASDAVSFITGTSISVDGGYLASGVNQ